jgi:hypothetical protein
MRDRVTDNVAISHQMGRTMRLAAPAVARTSTPGSSLTGWEIALDSAAEQLASRHKDHLTRIDHGAQ